VSLSAFVYFVLPSRLPDWQLTTAERLLLWLPLLFGLLLSGALQRHARTDPAVQR
jgi:hypothetical protein